MSILDSQISRSVATTLIVLACLFTAVDANALRELPIKNGSTTPPDSTWLMAQVSNSCQSTTPTGVEGLLVSQAGELYTQAQRAPAGERPALLQRVLTIIDSLVQAQPQSQVACQVRQPGGQVGVIPVAQVRAELAGSTPPNSTAAAAMPKKAEAVQLATCQHLAKIGATEQIAAECLALVWAQDLQIRKQGSTLFAYAIQSLNRQKSSNRAPLTFVPAVYTVLGACPFEGCTFGVWTALGKKQLFDSPNGTRAVGELVLGERVAAIDSELRVRPVKGVVISRINRLKIGETVYLLDYQGEGVSNVWIRGQVVPDPRWGQVCAPMPACETAIRFPLEMANSEWWVKVQRRNGDIAWTRGDKNPGFTGVDALGGDPIVIPDPYDSIGVLGLDLQVAERSEQPLKQAMVLVSKGQFFDKKYNNNVEKSYWAQHLGTDFKADSGTSVFATKSGKIQEIIGTTDPFNAAVIVESSDGFRQVYGHVRPSVDIFKDKPIEKGDLIGYIREEISGSPYRQHLHYGENIKGSVGTEKNPPKWGWGRAPFSTTCDEAVNAGWVDVVKIYGWGNTEGGNATENCFTMEVETIPLISHSVQSAAPVTQIPMGRSAPGEAANSTAPAIELQTRPSTSSNEGGVATATPAALEDAIRRASAFGPSVDLAKAYMWSGQFDRGMQLLAAGALSTYPDSNGDLAQRRTGDYVDVADWLSAHGRTDLALRVLAQAEKGVGTTDWTKWSTIAKGYFRAGAVAQTRGILLRWERAIAASRVPRPDPYHQNSQWRADPYHHSQWLADPYHQDSQRLIETYKELGLVQDVRRLAGALPVGDCGFPFYAGGYRLQGYLGQHQQAVNSARKCKSYEHQSVIGEIVLGLADSGNFSTAQALLRQNKIDIASLHFAKFEHFGAAYARAIGKSGKREEARMVLARSRANLASAKGATSCHENYGHHQLMGLQDLLEAGSFLEMHEQNQQTAQVARRFISQISSVAIQGCAYNFSRFAGALLNMARHETLAGHAEQGQTLMREADALVPTGQRVGQRVLAGTQALAMVQRTPSRMPRLLNSNSEATGTAGVEQTLRTYIAQFPDGKFLAAGDSPEWNGGQCVAWAKALFGLVASRSIAGLGGHAGQLGGNLEKMGFQLSDDPATPRVGAMVVWRDGDFGHVSVVTQVHSNPGSNQITEITVSEANWGRITEAGARRWGLSLDQAKDPLVFVTEMYGVAQQTRLPVSNLNRGNYRFFAYVYP